MYEHAWIFVNNYNKFGFLEISYNAIMHKYIFGQAYYIYLLKRIHTKFILYFSEFATKSYEFSKLKYFLEFKMKLENRKQAAQHRACIRPMASSPMDWWPAALGPVERHGLAGPTRRRGKERAPTVVTARGARRVVWWSVASRVMRRATMARMSMRSVRGVRRATHSGRELIGGVGRRWREKTGGAAE
jgi:hypothetical protein